MLRICATRNACQGIPTEALEDNAVADMLEALREAHQWAHIMVVTKLAPEMSDFRDKVNALLVKTTGGVE